MDKYEMPSTDEIREALLTLQDACRCISENYDDCHECPLFSREFEECGLSEFDYETPLEWTDDYSKYLIS